MSTTEKGEIQDEDSNFETYDPVKWETATEEKMVDKAWDEKDVPEPRLPHADKAVPETSAPPNSPILQDPEDLEKETELKLQLNSPPKPEFVRALKDSKVHRKPYFRKGDILRVINKARRGKLAGELNRFGEDGQMTNLI